MENKYYAPELSEFHIGFEYEENMSGEWVMYKYGDTQPWMTWSVPMIQSKYCYGNQLKIDVVRVKYLDRFDIESLGWKPFDTNDKIEYKGFIGIKEMFYATFQPLGKLILAKKYDRVSIYHPDYIRDGSGRFDGYATLVSNLLIKNISELRKLMKQLGIN